MSRIVLVGGSSSVGKTTLARQVAERDGVRHVEVDRIWPEHPGNVFRDSATWCRPVGDLVEILVGKARYLAPRIEAWIGEQTEPALLEGEGIEPVLAASCGARALFVIELNPARLHETLLARSRGFRELTREQQLAVSTTNALYNERLEREAARFGQPCIESQPWTTLVQRARAVLD